jgi:hypothetical protein
VPLITDFTTENSNLKDDPSADYTQQKIIPQHDQDLPQWFIYLFFSMMLLMLLSIWLIPEDMLLRWSMWWNNIPVE